MGPVLQGTLDTGRTPDMGRTPTVLGARLIKAILVGMQLLEQELLEPLAWLNMNIMEVVALPVQRPTLE